MIGFEWNYCGVCGVRLAPDDFDGICWDCDHKYYIPQVFSSKSSQPQTYPACEELEFRLETRMTDGYAIWVDGEYLSSWPDEDYASFAFKTPVGTILEDALILPTEKEAQDIVDKLKSEYQWDHVDDMIKVIKVYKEAMWVVERD